MRTIRRASIERSETIPTLAGADRRQRSPGELEEMPRIIGTLCPPVHHVVVANLFGGGFEPAREHPEQRLDPEPGGRPAPQQVPQPVAASEVRQLMNERFAQVLADVIRQAGSPGAAARPGTG